jgi:photosystem II stability/assembly factor-like uncharacterized protein
MRTDRLSQAPLTAVVSAGPDRVVAAGWRGVIAVSDDGSKSWKQADVPVREDITALAFPTPLHGWAAGNEGVLLETTDGGLTWTKRLDGNSAARLMLEKYKLLVSTSPEDKAAVAALKEAEAYLAQAPSRPFLDIAFEDEKTGYVAGTYGIVFRTVDGGKSWEPWFDRVDNPNGYNIYAIKIINGDVYLAGELGLALRLDRAQQRFVKLNTPYEGSFFALTGKPEFLIAAGLRGNALRSEDGGRNWQRVEFSGAVPSTISSATVMQDGSIALVTLSGQVFVSTDDGRRFQAVKTKTPMRYSSVAPLPGNALAIVGPQGVRVESTKVNP